MKIHPSQPAFPLSTDKGAAAYTSEGELVSAAGLTLRAYLAGRVLQGMMSAELCTVPEAADLLGISIEEYDNDVHLPKLLAKRSVTFADALIEELNKS